MGVNQGSLSTSECVRLVYWTSRVLLIPSLSVGASNNSCSLAPTTSMLEEHTVSALVFVAVAAALSLVKKRWGSRHPPFPPGPKGYPIIGNLLDFPENPIWEGLARMAQEHGKRTTLPSPDFSTPWGLLTLGWITDTDILHFDMMGSHLVVFSNSDAAAELEKGRSALHSDRVCTHSDTPSATFQVLIVFYYQPRFPMVTELYGPQRYSSTLTLTNVNSPQDGMLLGLLVDALWGRLAQKPQAFPPLFQRYSGEPVRREDLQGNRRFPQPAFRISRALFEACAFVRHSLVNPCIASASPNMA